MTAHLNGPVLDSGQENVARDFFKNFPLSYDPDYMRLFDDFVMVDDDQTNDWTVVKDTGASVGIQADTPPGVLLMSSTATTENDGSSIQGNEIFALATSRDIWFEAKLKVATAAQIDMFCGLSVNFATNPEAVLSATDWIGFIIADGDASILCKATKNSTTTSVDSQIDAVDATYVTLGFHIYEKSRAEFFVNRALVATLTTNLPDDENLAAAVMELSGQATGTQTLALDYILAVQTR